MRVDSANYYSNGTAALTNDTLKVYFNTNLEFDSLPLSSGGADSSFAIVGMGNIIDAQIDTPIGCPDTNFIYVLMSANDTILSHNRTRLALLASGLYSTDEAAAVAAMSGEQVADTPALPAGWNFEGGQEGWESAVSALKTQGPKPAVLAKLKALDGDKLAEQIGDASIEDVEAWWDFV